MNLHVQGTETTSRQVSIVVDLADTAEELMAKVLRHNGLTFGQYVSTTGSIVHEETHHTSHSYEVEEVDIKTPTPRQLEVLAAVTTFHKLVNEMIREQMLRT